MNKILDSFSCYVLKINVEFRLAILYCKQQLYKS